MQPDARLPGQRRGLAEQVRGDRQRGGRGHRHAQHGIRGRIVKAGDVALRGGEDLVGGCQHAVRGQAGRGCPALQRAAAAVHPQPDATGRLGAGGEQVISPAREQVVVVRDRAAAGQRQHAERAAHRGPVQPAVQPAPDRVERGQPVRQSALLGQAAGEPLEQVMVRRDEARGGQAAGAVHPYRALDAGCGPGPGRGDPAVRQHQVPAREFGASRPGERLPGRHQEALAGRGRAVDGGHRAAVDHQRRHARRRARGRPHPAILGVAGQFVTISGQLPFPIMAQAETMAAQPGPGAAGPCRAVTARLAGSASWGTTQRAELTGASPARATARPGRPVPVTPLVPGPRRAGPGAADAEPPDWWPYAGEFPHWHVWRGIAGLLYARRLMSSPPRVLRSQDPVELRDQIRQAELRR